MRDLFLVRDIERKLVSLAARRGDEAARVLQRLGAAPGDHHRRARFREFHRAGLADALLEKGASGVYAYISHGVLSGGAVARVTASRLNELVITDSIQPTEAVRVSRNIRVLSISTLIGEAIARTAAEESVSSLFD